MGPVGMTPEPTSHAPKRILVTGAAHGIGASIARLCVDAGHRIIAADIDREALSLLREGIPGIETAVLDVRDLAAWTRVVDEVERQGGPVDVLVNNAGVCLPGPCEQVTAEDDRMTIEVNLVGVMNGVRALLPRFLERERGHVINVASMAAFAPAPELATYCATKHAVRAYTHSCALDHRHTAIEWTLVCPNAVETPMLKAMRKRRAGVVVFTEKPMAPEKVARAIVDAIRAPRREVLVPSGRGKLIRFLGLFPDLLSRGMDSVERRGRQALDD
ncbi:MAG: SDR family NAD(P)-dependent oxidoreductase [Deltaproteobacteria bacterium]|nr:SDR family NAD(P)-dependent oxidoreductase [Deltaproteobacteria bacterium]NND29045.1 SDR family NAD(P)-dependent oxidoreductase [Myxococcales bacterium]NNK05989.1 SDR family NAD(P)-dependent oxidoreductase [Myxococcales bacterium]RZV52626.1 MAG: SDR family NAD(P)-dependent oxidoreductase [Deltaproteobacteria bacterium]